MDVADHAMLTQLLDEHGAALVLYAQQWCDGPEDVVQEAFMRLMRQRPLPYNLVGWLYRVVRNEAVSLSRSTGRRARHEAAAGSRRQAWFKPSGDVALDAAEAVAALVSLPIDQREAIVLRLWSGLSFEQIADVIGKSTSTAHRQYEMGLAALRENWSLPCPTPKRER